MLVVGGSWLDCWCTRLNAEGGQAETCGAANKACGVCSSAAMPQPYAAQPCGHVFCYYCLRSRTEADARFACPLCSERVTAMKPATRPLSGSSSVDIR